MREHKVARCGRVRAWKGKGWTIVKLIQVRAHGNFVQGFDACVWHLAGKVLLVQNTLNKEGVEQRRFDKDVPMLFGQLAKG